MLAEASADAGASSKAVASLYEQACVNGELRLDPRRGALVESKDVPEQVRDLAGWSRKSEPTRFIKFNDPPHTYIVLISYRNPRPRSSEVDCFVASRSLVFDDAVDVFTRGAEALPNHFNGWDGSKFWNINVPKKGYSKSLRRAPRGWTILGATTYRKPN